MYKIGDYVWVKYTYHRNFFGDYICHNCVKITADSHLRYPDSLLYYRGCLNATHEKDFSENDIIRLATETEIDVFERRTSMVFDYSYSNDEIVKMKTGEILTVQISSDGCWEDGPMFFTNDFGVFVFKDEIERTATSEEIFSYIMEKES